MAAPTYNTGNSKMFPAAIFVDGVEMGGTRREDAVEVRLIREHEGHGYAQAGSRDIELSIVGDDIEVVTRLAETTLANIVKYMPGLQLLESGGEAIELTSVVGLQAVRDELYVELQIKPIVGGQVTEDKDLWITLYRAYPKVEQADLSYALRTQQSIEITWVCFPDPTQNNSRGRLGSPDAVAGS